MKISTILRSLCIVAVAAVALAGICSQPNCAVRASANVDADFLVLSDTAKADAKPVTVLEDWQFTRARPAKCPFF